MSETFDQYTSAYLNDPNNVNTTTSTIDRLSGEGENNFTVEYPCIIKRVSLATTSGQPLITLSDDVKSIRRLTWKGFKLDPLPSRNFREVFQNATQTGRPFWYVFNNIGQNIIQLFPAPNETLTAVTTNLYGNEIPNRLIVEYYMTPDFTTNIIPTYFRRRLLKSYVLRGAYGIQGQGRNMKASLYYKDKWRKLKQQYGELLFDLHNKPRKLVVNGITASYYFPGNPVLPINKFGTSCDAGE